MLPVAHAGQVFILRWNCVHFSVMILASLPSEMMSIDVRFELIQHLWNSVGMFLPVSFFFF